jgi:hypothetical protein
MYSIYVDSSTMLPSYARIRINIGAKARKQYDEMSSQLSWIYWHRSLRRRIVSLMFKSSLLGMSSLGHDMEG